MIGLCFLCQAYVADPDPAAALSLGEQFTFKKMQAAFSIFKEMAGQPGAGGGAARSESGVSEGGGGSGSAEDAQEIARLREALARRDHEIEILVKMAKRSNHNGVRTSAGSSPSASMPGPSSSQSGKLFSKTSSGGSAIVDPAVLADKKKAFEFYCKNFADTKSLDSQKRELKERYSEAKETGARVNETRRGINKIKASIEQVRVKKSMLQDAIDAGQEGKHDEAQLRQLEQQVRAGTAGHLTDRLRTASNSLKFGLWQSLFACRKINCSATLKWPSKSKSNVVHCCDMATCPMHPISSIPANDLYAIPCQTVKMRGRLDGSYKVTFEKLRQLRSEVEHVQKLMDKSKKILLKQFGEWFSLMKRQHGSGRESGNGGLTSAAVGGHTGGGSGRPSSSHSEPLPKTRDARPAGSSKTVDRDVEAFLLAKKQMLARLNK